MQPSAELGYCVGLVEEECTEIDLRCRVAAHRDQPVPPGAELAGTAALTGGPCLFRFGAGGLALSRVGDKEERVC